MSLHSEIVMNDSPPSGVRKARSKKRLSQVNGKVLLDFVIALVLVVVTFPLMLLLALLVRLTSSGPALYSQLRVGRGGKPFSIYKFRTMGHECEKGTGAQWSRPGDSRITTVGRFLRASHLDELPQLINVLLGQMSLVGPRPERPEFTPALSQVIPNYERRMGVLPGVTGLAQVQLPPDSDLDSVRKKLQYDLWYIERRNLWLDLRLIFCTALKVGFLPMSLCCQVLGVPGSGIVERPQGLARIPLTTPNPEEIVIDAQPPVPVAEQRESQLVLEVTR
jgi:lipopolysaccharide/colanic/teichoic acid biosynthesis glycosyltransferase